IVDVARKSKWAAFVTNSFNRLERTILYPHLPNALELINLWKQVITTFLDHDANADTNHIFTSDGSMAGGDMIVEETMLAYMERIAATARDAAIKIPLKAIEELLRAHGGTSRRKVKAVYMWGKNRVIRLTEEQSDHLLNLFSLEDLATMRLEYAMLVEREIPTESDLENVANFVDCYKTGSLFEYTKLW
ncbi:MAG: hypothetical protein LQ349_007307, partial [Xanthoria aureola]